MKRSKKAQDDAVISNKIPIRRGSVIYVTQNGTLECANERVEWIAQEHAKGGIRYNSRLNVFEVAKSHRLPHRVYISLS